MYKEIEGDLIKLAQQGEFDVIAHGVNCFCRQKSGLAPQMVEAFGTDKFPLEVKKTSYNIYTDIDYTSDTDIDDDSSTMIDTGNYGNINKLGQIDYKTKYIWFKHPSGKPTVMNHRSVGQPDTKELTVVNCYTQFKIKKFNDQDYEYTTTDNPFNYEAFRLCMKKMNYIFKGKNIGLPVIGGHLAGGDPTIIKGIIENEFTDCNVTVVIFKP